MFISYIHTNNAKMYFAKGVVSKKKYWKGITAILNNSTLVY